MVDGNIEKISNGIMQVLAFSLIPLVWWFIMYRKESNFTSWIGFYKPELQVTYLGLLIFIVIYLIFYMGPSFLDLDKLFGNELKRVQNHENTATSNLIDVKDVNIKVVVTIFIGAFIQQALSEEILFRGFIYGRLTNIFNINTAIIIQAIIFGLLHNLLFFKITKSKRYHMFLFFVGGGGGLLFGILNNIVFNGSIIPSIVVHGLGNFTTGIIKLKKK